MNSWLSPEILQKMTSDMPFIDDLWIRIEAMCIWGGSSHGADNPISQMLQRTAQPLNNDISQLQPIKKHIS